MLTVSRTSVMNFENAVRGARNPLNSWDRMDSFFDENGAFVFGPNDLSLARRLCRAGGGAAVPLSGADAYGSGH